jgi:DNA repair and recombination protein RAD52
MAFTPEQVEALKAPLSRSHVRQRSQAGRSLSYIEGWRAIDEANRIFGFDAWDRETIDLQILGEPRQVDGKWRVAFMARVRITVRAPAGTLGIRRDGCGYGSGIDRDLGSAHESALKEAETDAMKRALMTFGNPFGLALYDKDQAQVVDEARPRNSNGAEPKPEKSAHQARKDGDWQKFLEDLHAHDGTTAGLLKWVASRHPRIETFTWRGEAIEEWRQTLVHELAAECHSAVELERWRNEARATTDRLPLDWQLAASGALEDAIANFRVTA